MTTSRGICPLCKESYPLSDLTAHIAVERAEVRDYTIMMIQKRHPQWREDDGACRRCWRIYKGLGRFVSFFHKPKPTVATNR